MLDLNVILANELKSILGHKATAEEMASVLEYIEESEIETANFLELINTIQDWKSDFCQQCAECGDWYLPEEMEDGFCCEECKNDYMQELEWERDERESLIRQSHGN